MLRAWLESIGLEKYATLFEENEIEMATLRNLTERDLTDLGLAFGPRRRLLNALAVPSSVETNVPDPAPPSAQSVKIADGERRQLTVLFCDMVGFTEIASRVDPEVLHRIIALYEEACTAGITRYDGYVFQRLGDGIVAFFGYPFAHEREAERAIHAGLAIMLGLAHLDVPVVGRLRARIGIASGLVVTSPERGAVGETMNLAARLQAMASENSIVISEAVHRNAGAVFHYKDLGEHALKGIAQKTRLYRVLVGVNAEDAVPSGRSTRGELVGREQELGLLLDRWERAAEGAGQVILLLGEPGIGKSRLLQTLDEKLSGIAHRRLELRCSPYFTQTPLHPLVERLPGALGWKSQDDTSILVDKLVRFLQELDIPTEESVALLMAFLSRPPSEQYPLPVMSPERQRRRTTELLADVPIAISRREPVLLAVEDIHWADPTTLDLIGRHIEHAATARFMLVLTARSGFEWSWGNKSYLSPVMLNRLTRRQSEIWLHEWVSGKRLPVEVTSRLIDRADGVPLFLEELTRAVLESDALRKTAEGYELVGDITSLTIPTTLQDSLMARLDRMGSAKEVAQMAAVIGREFDEALCRRVIDTEPDALAAALVKLTGAELILRRGTSSDGIYSFKHALVRDAAYESLLLSTRGRVHERIATALVEVFPDRAAQQPEVVAHHFEVAGLNMPAVDWWRRAGEHAVGRSASAEAAAHFRRALNVLLRESLSAGRDAMELRLRLMLGMELIKRLGWAAPEVKSEFTRAQELSDLVEDPGARYICLHLLAANLHIQGDLPTAEAMHREGLVLAQQVGDPDLIVGGHMGVGFVLHWSGKFSEGTQHMDRALQIGSADRASRYVALYALNPMSIIPMTQSVVYCICGHFDQAHKLSLDGLAYAHTYPHAFTLTYALMIRGFVQVLLHDIAGARDTLHEALRRSADQEFALLQSWVTAFLGFSYLKDGLVEKASELLAKSNAELDKSGALLASPISLALEGSAHLGQGHPQEAQRCIERAFNIVGAIQGYEYESLIWSIQGDIFQALKAYDLLEAERAYKKAIEVARVQGAKLFELEATAKLAQIWRGQGRAREALALLQTIYDSFDEGFQFGPLTQAGVLLDALRSECA